MILILVFNCFIGDPFVYFVIGLVASISDIMEDLQLMSWWVQAE